MNNIKRGNIWNIAAASLSLSTIFCWFGKAFKISNSQNSNSTTIRIFSWLNDGPFLSFKSFLLVVLIVLSILALYKSISGYLNDKNNCLVSTMLLSITAVVVIFCFAQKYYLIESYNNSDTQNSYNVEMCNNLIFMLVLLTNSFITSIFASITAYSNNNKS